MCRVVGGGVFLVVPVLCVWVRVVCLVVVVCKYVYISRVVGGGACVVVGVCVSL